MVAADDIEWTPARGLPPRILGFALMLCVVAEVLVGVVGASVGISGLARAIEFAPSGAIGAGAIAVVWLFGIAVPVIVIASALSVPEVRIGLSSSGVRLVSRLRTKELRWDQLWPSDASPPLRWMLVSYHVDERAGRRFFWATAAQARALAVHPKAPFNLFPPELRDWLARPPAAPHQSTP